LKTEAGSKAEAATTGKVLLVGAGPGDPGLLTLRAAHALRNADVLLYDALASGAVLAFAPASCEKIFVGKRGGNHAMPQEEIEALAIRKAREGNSVVRLKGGDPFVFGRGGEEAQAFHAAGVPFEIVPGISSALAAPAYAGIPVTHRDHNPAFTVATGHEDPEKPVSTLEWAKLADPHRTLIFLMAMGNLEGISEQLRAHGLRKDTPVAVIQDGTRPTQRTAVGTLATISAEVTRHGLVAPAVVIIGDVVDLRKEIRWFDTTPLFGKRVLVTRPTNHSSFIDELVVRGAEPIVAPTISIGAPDDIHPAHHALDSLHGYAWIVFTSRNGVEAAFAYLNSLNSDARYFGRRKVAAIGPKTAETLLHHGIRADLAPDEYIAEALARSLIEATTEGDRILIFRAQEARDVLPQMLNDASRHTTAVPAYKTSYAIDPHFAEKVARADILTFTSASTVKGYIANFPTQEQALEAAQGKILGCIGPITAAEAEKNGLHSTVTADSYTTDGLLTALEKYLCLHK